MRLMLFVTESKKQHVAFTPEACIVVIVTANSPNFWRFLLQIDRDLIQFWPRKI